MTRVELILLIPRLKLIKVSSSQSDKPAQQMNMILLFQISQIYLLEPQSRISLLKREQLLKPGPVLLLQ